MKKISYTLTVFLLILLTQSKLYAQSKINLTENFDATNNTYEKIGRGVCKIDHSVLTTRDAYLCFGENNWADYEVKFSSRVPDTASQVQICAGFRAANRDDRYILMLKGGIEKYLYLARLGYMGSDDFLALRELDFHPEPGKWYNFKIQVAGDRIRVFLNNEDLPRIDVIDKSSNLAPSGKVTLGGSWITNEFDNLSINSIDPSTIINLPVQEYAAPFADKETKRVAERNGYKPLTVNNLTNSRTEISLNGKWLFAPGYEIDNETKAISPSENDDKWHVMIVPNFWNPIRVWLYGEKYNSGGKGVADNYYQKETDRCDAYTFDYKKTNEGWYRQWINLPANIKGKNLQLSFDAVSKVAEVWVNGKEAGKHVGMFGAFQVDATSLLHPGKNLVTVKVVRDYVKDIKDADKIAGVAVTVEVTQKMVKDLAHGFLGDDPAGIWQPVSLIITDPIRIEDVFIKPNLTGADFDITIKNYNKTAKTVSASTVINGFKFKDAIYKGISLKQLTLKAGEEKVFSFKVANLKPKLWSPDYPNLYNFKFSLLSDNGKKELDTKVIRSGFRTFRAIGDYFYLNGKKYWLRGGNQTAMPLAPNDTVLADKFCKLMKAGNIMVTRTHTVPYTETWMNASDENGIAVSYEGTWPWLFLQSSMPEQKLIDLWKYEFYDLIKKYRNHPSLILWTVNNEMKFYENDPDINRAKIKMKIISDVVKQMRLIDPTRSIVFDSNYKRNVKRFGADFFKDIDDGDIEDPHAYINWYDGSLFDQFNGEWQKRNKFPGRPLISQEMSTGYTDETGHPTRFYNYVHQNPEALDGKFTYEYNNPVYFLTSQAFITKELAEALRRSNDKAAGVLHFSASTWFQNVYLPNKIKPFPVYYEMKNALQPVLVSAELWGRHFYAGEHLPTKICVVNDKEDGSILPATELHWQLLNSAGQAFAKGGKNVAELENYGREWIDPEIIIPPNLPQSKIEGKLMLQLKAGGKIISENSYDILFVEKDNLDIQSLHNKKIAVVDFNNTIIPSLNFLGIRNAPAKSVSEAIDQKADVYILSGLDSVNTNAAEITKIRTLIAQGGKVLLTRSGNFSHLIYPEYVRGVVNFNGEIANMDIPESDVFDGMEPLEIRYFNNNEREMPSVISGGLSINRSPYVEALASFTKVHGYLQGNVTQRMTRLDKIKGFPIVKIKDGNGDVILSEMLFEKAVTDPVAAKLLINMLNDLAK
jgi:beta-galactosidase